MISAGKNLLEMAMSRPFPSMAFGKGYGYAIIPPNFNIISKIWEASMCCHGSTSESLFSIHNILQTNATVT